MEQFEEVTEAINQIFDTASFDLDKTNPIDI